MPLLLNLNVLRYSLPGLANGGAVNCFVGERYFRYRADKVMLSIDIAYT